MRILDIGCGFGDIAFGLANLGHSVVGIDTDSDSIKIAQLGSGQLGIQDVVFQTDYSGIEEQEFDAIICNHVIEHVADPLEFMIHLRALLRNDGVLYLATPNRLWPIDPHSGKALVSWSDARLFTWTSLTALMSEAGYSVNELTSYVLRNLDQLYEGPEHHPRYLYWLAKTFGRFIPSKLVNVLADSFFVTATPRGDMS